MKPQGTKIAVVGAGVIGTDVAFNVADYGYQVILKDIDRSQLDRAREKIARDFKMFRLMKPTLKSESVDEILGRICFTTECSEFESVDIVIENVPEDWRIKQQVYLELKSICSKTVIYGVNTSCTSITKVGSLLNYPDRVIGIHFMNPVPLKRIVELVRGYHTSEATILEVKSFLQTLNKSAVLSNDSPGFIANRLSHLFMNEAAFLVQDQVAGPKEIDTLFRQGYGHAMGPLQTADLIGLDTVVNSLEVLYTEYQDSKFRCCPLLKRMVSAGLTGRKSGQGFYKYDDL